MAPSDNERSLADLRAISLPHRVTVVTPSAADIRKAQATRMLLGDTLQGLEPLTFLHGQNKNRHNSSPSRLHILKGRQLDNAGPYAQYIKIIDDWSTRVFDHSLNS